LVILSIMRGEGVTDWVGFVNPVNVNRAGCEGGDGKEVTGSDFSFPASFQEFLERFQGQC